MSRRILLRDWDHPGFFELDLERGRLARVPAPGTGGAVRAAEGFVKACVLGPAVAVYMREGVWRFRHGKHEWPLLDPALNLVVRRWWLGRRIDVECRGIRSICRISDLGQRIVHTLDPATDRLDQEIEDFPLWLAERRAEARREEPDLARPGTELPP